MTTRRRVHIDIALPELTPVQADLLWNFLEDLAMDLWDAYEPELLEVEHQRSFIAEPDHDWTAAGCDDLFENSTLRPVNSDDPDPDF